MNPFRRPLAALAVLLAAAPALAQDAAATYDWSLSFAHEDGAVAWSVRRDETGASLVQIAARYGEERPAEGAEPARWGQMLSWRPDCATRRYTLAGTRYYSEAGSEIGERPGSSEAHPFTQAGEFENLLAAACGAAPPPGRARMTASWEDIQLDLDDLVYRQFEALHCAGVLTLGARRQPASAARLRDERLRVLAAYNGLSGDAPGDNDAFVEEMAGLLGEELITDEDELEIEIDLCRGAFVPPGPAAAAPTAPSAPAAPAAIDLGPRFRMLEAHTQPAEGRWSVEFNRRGNTNLYDGTWVDQRTLGTGTETVEVLGVQNGQFVIRRGGGTYTFPLNPDGTLGRGDASWAANPTFYAEIFPGDVEPPVAQLAPYDIGPVLRLSEIAADGHRWNWTWTRRGASNVYDGLYTEVRTGERGTDILEVLGVEGGRLILWRRSGPNAFYHFPVNPDGTLGRGTASWVSTPGFTVEIQN